MAKKTFKIGECCKGGIISVETKGQNISVIGREYVSGKEFTRLDISADNSDVYKKLFFFISDLTSAYYTDKVIDFIKSKVTLAKNYFY